MTDEQSNGRDLTRRGFLNASLACAAGGALASVFPHPLMAGSTPARPPRPNIIFIMADDLGYGDLGSYGQKRIATPHLDQLAADGVRYTQCYSGSPVCAPARSVLMTGQHTGHTRVRGNFGVSGRVPLRAEDVTVADLLKDAGYATGITGKWGLGEPGTTGIPRRKGFDEWFGYLNQRHAHDYYPEYLWRNEERHALEGNRGGRQEQYSHDLFTEFALDFVGRRRRDPFFLYLPYTIPHSRYQIPDLGRYADEPWPRDARVHAAMITRMDRDIGRLMALLKERGMDENTLVMFTSDNGAAQRWEGIFDASGALRGRKRDLYEGGIRVPMIARWPGRIERGRVDHTPWYFTDVLPTFAQLAGAPVPRGIDGASIVPSLLGRAQPELADRFMYWEFHEGGFQQAVRQGEWKAVLPQRGQPMELYHLPTDIAESRNVAPDNPDMVGRITEYLKTARTESEEWPVG